MEFHTLRRQRLMSEDVGIYAKGLIGTVQARVSIEFSTGFSQGSSGVPTRPTLAAAARQRGLSALPQ